MREKRTVITVVSIAMLAFTLSACGILEKQNAKAKAQVIPAAAGTWCKLQMAYIVEWGKIGSFEQIEYTAPVGGSFKYGQKIENGVAGWLAESTEKLAECPIGSQWIVLKDINNTKVILPEDKNCQELTPHFDSSCK